MRGGPRATEGSNRQQDVWNQAGRSISVAPSWICRIDRMLVSPRWRKVGRRARTAAAAAGVTLTPHLRGKRAPGGGGVVTDRGECSLGASPVQSDLGVGGQQLRSPGSLVRVCPWVSGSSGTTRWGRGRPCRRSGSGVGRARAEGGGQQSRPVRAGRVPCASLGRVSGCFLSVAVDE